MTLPGLAVKRPVTTAMVFLSLGLLGLISLSRLPVQLYPELIFPEVFVSLTLSGASPEQIERDLLIPAEEEIGKLDGVQQFESIARANNGSIRISYAPNTDMKFALLQLQSRMARLQSVLPELTRVDIQRFDSSDLSASVMQLNVLGDGDLDWLREFSEQKIKPELEAVDGVVNAQILGGRRQAIEVIVEPHMLQAHNLTLSQVRSRINATNLRRQYLGHVYEGSQSYAVSMEGQFQDLIPIRDVVVKPDISLRLGDIATVRYGLQEQVDQQRINGKPAVGIRIQKDDEANLIEVARGVEKAIVRLNQDFEDEGIELVVSTSQADMMEEALNTLKQAAVVGGLLGLFVLFLFLRNLKFVTVLLLAIPASLLITFNLMFMWNLSLNVLTLCGLALAVGMLTDNGIVVMENIFKHYERGKSPALAAQLGTEEVSRAVVAATLTTVTVFLPVVFIESDAQDILRELALSMAFPLLASLFVALTLVPSLCARTLSSTGSQHQRYGKGMEMYIVLLKDSLRHRVRVVLGIAGGLLVTLICSFYFMLQQDVRQEETRFTVYIDLPEGATLEATDKLVKEVEGAVQGIQGLDRFVTSVQENQANIQVILKKISERPNAIPVEQIKDKLDDVFAEIQGAVIGYEPKTGISRNLAQGSGGQRRSSGGFNLTGGQTAEQAVVRGYDFTVLKMIADDLTFRLQEMEDIIDPNAVRADAERGSPEIQVLPDEVAMFDRRLSLQNVLTSVNDARPDGFQTSVPFLTSEGLEISIQVRTVDDPEKQTMTVEDFRQTPILSGPGRFVILDDVAHVRTDEGRAMILRTDQSRRAMVSYRFTTEIMDSQPLLEEARVAVQNAIHDMVLPEGYNIEIVEAEEEVIYYWMMGIATGLIFMILASLFESFSAPFVILCTLPTAVIGSCWALMFSGTGLTQQEGPMALLGFIVLLGIAVNNGIMLIDAIETLRKQYGFRRERAILVAGRSRVRPIFMTSATTLLGILPLSLKYGGDYEIWPPFAITVIGGLSVSMVSTLIFIPVVYVGMDQIKRWLTNIGWMGIVLGSFGSMGLIYGVHEQFQSLFWTALSVLPAWFGCLGLIWIGICIQRSRLTSHQVQAPVKAIYLSNLTKIYGAPGKLRQEWARFERRHVRLHTQGVDHVDHNRVRDALFWKIPLLGLMIFLHTYFEDGIYLYLITLVTWAIFFHIGQCLSFLLGKQLQNPWGIQGVKWGMALSFVFYIHMRLNLLSVTVANLIVWVLYVLVKWLADQVRFGHIDLDQLSGRLAWGKKLVYRSAASVPIIGVPRPEFRALAGVNLEIGQGMFGLLGPNGAGKTTLMRIICQVLLPSYGSVLANGENLASRESARGIIGYLPQHFGLYDHMSAFDYLNYRALLEGFKDKKTRTERVMACLEQVHLTDRKSDLIGSFSGGMKQRVGIAQTLLHLPQIIVVDEPTAGLDPLERIRFRNLLARFSQDRIVIFSTHIVEDISGSCNRLAVLNKGQVQYVGTPLEMRNVARGRVFDALVGDIEFSNIEKEYDVISHIRSEGGVRVRFLSEKTVAIGSAVDPSLEDAYLYLLRHGVRAC